jgi:DNA-binding MarR family transcriptional regulator
MTGVLDRLEKAAWIARDRAPDDRRSVVLSVRPDRVGEVFALYSGMNKALDDICADYTEEQLAVIADFLVRASAAGHEETANLDRG